jgi:hypothetical protein
MTWAAYGPQNMSDNGIRWHDVSEDANQPARVPAGRLPPGPLVSDRSVRRGSGVKRDFACTLTRRFHVLVVRRSQLRLRLEGRTRTLSGASPDLEPSQDFCTFPPS